MIRLVLAFLLTAQAAAAQGDLLRLPALFDVTGVAADDVLNVRDNPRPTGDRIGDLPPDATGLEVTALSESGDWGRINLGERAGWVSMRYLAARPTLPGTYFQGALSCFGAEPGWSLVTTQGGALWSTIEAPDPQPVERLTALRAQGRPDMPQALLGQLPDETSLTVILGRGTCSDGMSDQLYGLEANAVVAGRRLLTGCCSVRAAE